jgi:hypothetical protein
MGSDSPKDLQKLGGLLMAEFIVRLRRAVGFFSLWREGVSGRLILTNHRLGGIYLHRNPGAAEAFHDSILSLMAGLSAVIFRYSRRGSPIPGLSETVALGL